MHRKLNEQMMVLSYTGALYSWKKVQWDVLWINVKYFQKTLLIEKRKDIAWFLCSALPFLQDIRNFYKYYAFFPKINTGWINQKLMILVTWLITFVGWLWLEYKRWVTILRTTFCRVLTFENMLMFSFF